MGFPPQVFSHQQSGCIELVIIIKKKQIENASVLYFDWIRVSRRKMLNPHQEHKINHLVNKKCHSPFVTQENEARYDFEWAFGNRHSWPNVYSACPEGRQTEVPRLA